MSYKIHRSIDYYSGTERILIDIWRLIYVYSMITGSQRIFQRTFHVDTQISTKLRRKGVSSVIDWLICVIQPSKMPGLHSMMIDGRLFNTPTTLPILLGATFPIVFEATEGKWEDWSQIMEPFTLQAKTASYVYLVGRIITSCRDSPRKSNCMAYDMTDFHHVMSV